MVLRTERRKAVGGGRHLGVRRKLEVRRQRVAGVARDDGPGAGVVCRRRRQRSTGIKLNTDKKITRVY